MGHWLINSHWFKKSPQTESGWKRRSKKMPMYPYFARKCSWRNMCFLFRAISSRHLILILFSFCSGSLSIAGGWRQCGALLIFLSKCSTRVPLTSPGITRSPSKRTGRGTLSQKTRNLPIWQAVNGYVANINNEGPCLTTPLLWKVGLIARSVWGPTRLRLCWAFTF